MFEGLTSFIKSIFKEDKVRVVYQAVDSDGVVDSFRSLVMPKHLNPANRLFGGQMMAWIDEAAAMYAMCQVGSNKVVTLKVTELLFLEPVMNDDFLVFETSTKKVGTSSLTVHVNVYKKDLRDRNHKVSVCTCDVIMVKVGEDGKPTPHGITI